MKKDKIIFLERCKEYFETNGLDLTLENGKLLPLDKSSHIPTWSVDVLVLTEVGITSGYFRNEDSQFTITGLAPIDLYLKDVKLIVDKYVPQEQISKIRLLKKGLKF